MANLTEEEVEVVNIEVAAVQMRQEVRIVLEEEVTEWRGADGKFKVSIRRPHVHQKGNLGMKMAGPHPDGVRLDVIQMNSCPGCHLMWFEQLEPQFPQLQERPSRILDPFHKGGR